MKTHGKKSFGEIKDVRLKCRSMMPGRTLSFTRTLVIESGEFSID